MTEMSIIFANNESDSSEYFIDELRKDIDIAISQKAECDFCVINIKSNNGLLKEYVWKSIVATIQHFYKYNMIIKKLFKSGEINLAESLIIGALLGFDAASEQEEIIGELKQCGSRIYIKGVVQFRLYSVVKNWKSLINLATRLLLQCRDKRDYLDIVFFLMAASSAKDKKVFVYSNRSGIVINVEGEEIIVPNLTYNAECDAIMALIAVCPTEIEIASEAGVSKQFYNTVKCIGEHIAISKAILDT